jgi:hypothetical protein
MECITILYALALFGLFKRIGSPSFPGKRPIYPQYGDEEPSSDDPKYFPNGFLPVLMKFDGKKFVSIEESESIQVNLPAEGEESLHDFEEGLDFSEEENFYFFFTETELTVARYDIAQKPGFNYWNPEAVRWEPRGHVLENSWADHRFYIVPNGYVAVCYRLNQNGDVCSEHPDLPVFKQDDIETAWCFQNFFGDRNYDPRQDFELAYFFIEFSFDQLRAAGVEVPANLAGYRFNPETAVFEKVKKSATPCGWDSITKSFQPICEAEDEDGCKCCSGKLAFPWGSSMSGWILREQSVFTYMTQDHTEAKQNSKLMRNFFSQNGGPYCDCNCFCDHCNRFHLPWEKSSHHPYDGENILSEWTCDD